jgi:excisionase family DNA binding protein
MQKRNQKESKMPTNTAPIVESPLLTAKETAKFLRVSDSTLYKLLRQKRLKPIRLGDRVLFSRVYLQRFCEGGE